jgi:hypothetical protein
VLLLLLFYCLHALLWVLNNTHVLTWHLMNNAAAAAAAAGFRGGA